MAQQQSDPLSQCIALTLQGSQIEATAMELDRQHNVPEAMEKYQEAVEILQSATNACPEDHVDRAALEQHCNEIRERRAYLEGLPAGSAVDLPLETHIHSVELTMRPSIGTGSSGGMRVLGAVAAIGGVAGMMLTRGPVGGLAFAAGAAYTATRSDRVGDTARVIGQAGVTGAERAVAFNEKHQISGKAMAAGAATAAKAQDLGSHAVAKAQDLNSQYHISEKAKMAATKAHDLSLATAAKTRDLGEKATVAGAKTVNKAKDLDAQYGITENAMKTAETVGKHFSTGFAMVSGLLQTRRTSASGNEQSEAAQVSSGSGSSQTGLNESPSETSTNQPPAQ